MNISAASALGRNRPVKGVAGFSTWQPNILARMAGFGQERTLSGGFKFPPSTLTSTRINGDLT
jgi:hypothetical protein